MILFTQLSTIQAAAKDYWCEAPAQFKDVPISLWKNISQTENGCRIYNYPWQNVTAADIMVSDVIRSQSYCPNLSDTDLPIFTCLRFI